MKAPAEVVEADRAEAKRLGINSTPTFLVGEVDADGNVHVKVRIRGVQDLVVFRKVIADVASLRSNQSNLIEVASTSVGLGV
jgi:predicted DsbA family dithiol-disulfide isomerase